MDLLLFDKLETSKAGIEGVATGVGAGVSVGVVEGLLLLRETINPLMIKTETNKKT